MNFEEAVIYLREKREVVQRLIAKGLLSKSEVEKLREIGIL